LAKLGTSQAVGAGRVIFGFIGEIVMVRPDDKMIAGVLAIMALLILVGMGFWWGGVFVGLAGVVMFLMYLAYCVVRE
jgi:hypothetical protein